MAISTTKDKVRLDYVTYLAFVFSVLVFLSLIRRLFDVDFPVSLMPMSIALIVAAYFYGGWVGTNGKQRGPSFKSWVLAKKMVLTGLCVVLGLFLIQVFAFGFFAVFADGTALVLYGVQIVVAGCISLVSCRFAFILGVKSGYSIVLKKENRST